MSFANPAGWWLLLGAVPIVLLHVLRPQHRAVAVSSGYLWRRVDRPVSSARPWQRLRPSWQLLTQLAIVGLLAALVAQPVRVTDAPLGDHTVFVVDASGSMSALDGEPDRVAAALQRAERLRDELPQGGVASIVVASTTPRVLLTTSADRQAFSDGLARIEPTAGPAAFAEAFALAESLDTGAGSLSFVLLSDGGLSDDEVRLLPPGTVYERVGARSMNRAITGLDVEPRGSGLHVRATVRNTGGPGVRQPLRVDVDGRTVATEELAIDEGETVEVELDVPAGERVEAFLDGSDLLAIDDRAVAVAPRRPELTVLVAGDATFLLPLLQAIPGITVETSPTGRPATAGEDVAIYSGVPVPADPGAPFLAIAPPGGAPGVTVTGTVPSPAVTAVRSDDPRLDGVDLSELTIAEAQAVAAPAADVLVAAADGSPLLLTGRAAGWPYAYLTFGLADSDLPLQVAYPVLGDRLVGDLAGTALPSGSLTVGQPLPVDPDRTTEVTSPASRTSTVEPGDPAPLADRPGFYQLAVDDGPPRTVAVNPPAAESALAPAASLPVEVLPPVERDEPARGERSLAVWFVVPLLVLLGVEAVMAWRRRAVGRRQQAAALGLRAAVATLALAALLAPAVTRPAGRVATVFAIDGSASLGRDGRAAAEAWVGEALDAREGDDLAGVLGFGGDARLDQVVSQEPSFDGLTVQIDPERTDIATALRLAGAVLPSDARRRIVVVSDGRATDGDARAEAERLSADGVHVDIRTAAGTTGADAAVTALDVPSLARSGESVAVTATVTTAEAGPAVVSLTRDGVEVASQTVELASGDTTVGFDDEIDGTGVVRYGVAVQRSGDRVTSNDRALAAVPIEGPARVLVVEGRDGGASTLVRALEAGGLVVDRVAVGGLGPVDELATYSSIVLADVDARTLSSAQLQDLATAVEDLGRGLVTVGGDQSYGLGGYRDTELEALLPVVSEILDPQRRQTVAQVLSIDTSGSMAACHCRDDQTAAQRTVAGVNKTDISRAAAARTIASLTADDEVGVLAWSGKADWIVDLQRLPADEVVAKALGSLEPEGETNLRASLTAAAEELRASRAALKHIILFTDGFTAEANVDAVADEAARLHDEDGITVSVVATGEGAAPALERIAVAGAGRFYPGTDLARVPQVMADEAVLASRDFVNEGEFVPTVTATGAPVEGLATAPPLYGYIATTAKPAATTLLEVGDEGDPLLSRWSAGLGRVASWTSDASAAWSKDWAAWDGYVDFWTGVVKDTFPSGATAGAARATVRDGRLLVSVGAASAFPDGARAVARVAGPDGQQVEAPLERTSATEFAAEVPAPRPGTYAVGVQVTSGADVVLASTALASSTYPAEYRIGQPDTEFLEQLSALTGGRGAIEASEAFDPDGLPAGERRLDLSEQLFVAAALLFPLAVALSRLAPRPTAAALAGRARLAGGRLTRWAPTRPGAERPATPAAPSAGPPPSPGPPATGEPPPDDGPAGPPVDDQPPVTTASELLQRKRDRR